MDTHGSSTLAGNMDKGSHRPGSRWRVVAWGTAALLLLLPLIAMQFTDAVNWSPADFALAAVLLLGVGIPLELAVRKTGDAAYRAGVGVALGAAFLLLWANGAVGLIGSENNEANLMYFGVLAVGVLGAFLARFQAAGLARALFATALAQALVAAIALFAGLGGPANGPFEIVAVNAFFVALFAGAGFLFREAARSAPAQDAA